jgi:hypothetical protein
MVVANYKDNKEFKIIDNNGNDIFNLTSEQAVGKDEQWLTSVIGWSDNSQKVWLNVHDHRCIYIQLIDRYYRLFEIPDISNAENLDITPIIDFNTGDYYYTDYDPRVLRGRNTEEYWNEYKKQTFHLYKYNFFNGEQIELESIYRNGFILTAKNNKKSIIKEER